jgi:ABC-type nitrate/sulfonate/bicarbonate transport system permease component
MSFAMLESVYVAFAPGQLVGTFRKVEDAYEAIIGFLNTIPQESTLDFTFLPL